MFAILLLMIIGFLIGLTYVMAKRKIRPGKALATTFLALATLGVWKLFKHYYNRKGAK